MPFCAHAGRFGFLSMTTPLFLFDGDCGLCKNFVDRMKKRIAPPINFVTYQSVDIIAPGVSPLLTRVQAIFYRNRHRLPGGTESCRIPPG